MNQSIFKHCLYKQYSMKPEWQELWNYQLLPDGTVDTEWLTPLDHIVYTRSDGLVYVVREVREGDTGLYVNLWAAFDRSGNQVSPVIPGLEDLNAWLGIAQLERQILLVNSDGEYFYEVPRNVHLHEGQSSAAALRTVTLTLTEDQFARLEDQVNGGAAWYASSGYEHLVPEAEDVARKVIASIEEQLLKF